MQCGDGGGGEGVGAGADPGVTWWQRCWLNHSVVLFLHPRACSQLTCSRGSGSSPRVHAHARAVECCRGPYFLKTTQGKPGTLFITPIFSILAPKICQKLNLGGWTTQLKIFSCGFSCGFAKFCVKIWLCSNTQDDFIYWRPYWIILR